MDIRLKQVLLACGGNEVIDFPESHLEALLERGRVFSSKRRKCLRQDMHCCHQLAALYYARHFALGWGGSCDIVTGYALSTGVWVQHSWIWDGKKVIDPNIEDAELYFGVILSPAEAKKMVVMEVFSRLPGMAA